VRSPFNFNYKGETVGLFIFGLVLGLIAIGCLVVRHFEFEGDRYPVWIGGVVIGFIAVLVLFFSMYRSVPPRSVGIEVQLGKVQGTLQSGPHLVKPWTKVINFPSTIETTKLQGQGTANDEDGPCVSVRLGNQTTACVNVTAQWQVDVNDGDGVDKLYAQYRSFDHIEPSLVMPQTLHSLYKSMETFNPIATLNRDTGSVDVRTADFEAQGQAELQEAVGSAIKITKYTINLIQYDQDTQNKINNFAGSVADTRIAQQQEITNQAKSRANDALASSDASKNPAVLAQNCLDFTERAVKAGQALPPTWSCFGGGGASPLLTVK
jgi:regulator of protease activity HflC (stomatin/prohibitin superfamily)